MQQIAELAEAGDRQADPSVHGRLKQAVNRYGSPQMHVLLHHPLFGETELRCV